MNIKKHYDTHLADFYSWMLGNFNSKKDEFIDYCKQAEIKPSKNGIAIDLGAGNGIQSVALAEIGFDVTAIDFNLQLLDEIQNNKKNLPIEIIEDNIKNILNYKDKNPELIICCGDTISHLESKNEIKELLIDIHKCLDKEGNVLLSFRDYSFELEDTNRFIPVKSDDMRILTCFLEYFEKKVRVTDILHQKKDKVWEQKISSYEKVRISKHMIIKLLIENKFEIINEKDINRMVHVVAVKKS